MMNMTIICSNDVDLIVSNEDDNDNDVDLIHAEHLPHLVQADSLPIGVPSLLHDDDDEYHEDDDDDDDMS